MCAFACVFGQGGGNLEPGGDSVPADSIAVVVLRTYKRLLITLEELDVCDIHRETETAALVMTLAMYLFSKTPSKENELLDGLEQFVNSIDINTRSTTFQWRIEFYSSFIHGRKPLGPWDKNMATEAAKCDTTRPIVAFGDVIYDVEAIDNYDSMLYSSQQYGWANKVRIAMIQQIVPELKKMCQELTIIRDGGMKNSGAVRHSRGCLTTLLLVACPVIVFVVALVLLS